MNKRELGLNYTLTFGKYKGNTVEEIIEDDPDYIEWAIDNIEWFGLNEEADILLTDVLFNSKISRYVDNTRYWQDDA